MKLSTYICHVSIAEKVVKVKGRGHEQTSYLTVAEAYISSV